MSFDEIKKSVLNAIDESREEIISIGEEIFKNPELGYFEEKTSAFVRSVFDKYSIEYTYPHAVTGVKAKLTNGNGPNIVIIGEMDALKCPKHPSSNKDGNAHACGHHAQIAAMLGAAIGFAKSEAVKSLSGSVTFFAVPAEEFIDLDARRTLKNEGKIKYSGGKQQLLYEGAFDDADIAIMLHAQPDEPDRKVYVRGYNLGFLAKTITFCGKTAHGSTPFDATNALNAAALAILGIHSNRETFRDEDRIRIHPIITKGGDVVNSVPDEVVIDTYVRGATLEAIKKGNNAVERSVKGAAQMIGATANTEDFPGYLPLCESNELNDVFEAVVAEISGKDSLVYGEPITGSTDMGDLSSLIPSIQPSIGGFSGKLHSEKFEVADAETAYILAAKLLAATVCDLLSGGGKKAYDVIKAYKGVMNKEEYIKYLKGE